MDFIVLQLDSERLADADRRLELRIRPLLDVPVASLNLHKSGEKQRKISEKNRAFLIKDSFS